MSFLPDWLTGFDREAYNRGLEADRKNAEITRDLEAKGLITERDYGIAQDHYAGSLDYDPDKAINGAFQEGLDTGTSNVRSVLGSPFGIVPSLLKIVPWQVWLILAAWGAWRLGWFKGVVKK